MSEQEPAKPMNVNTGGGGYVGGHASAGGDVNLGAKHIAGDEVHGHKITQLPWQPLPSFTPSPPPAPGDLPDPGPLPPGSGSGNRVQRPPACNNAPPGCLTRTTAAVGIMGARQLPENCQPRLTLSGRN
jgi:hypothetical protein